MMIMAKAVEGITRLLAGNSGNGNCRQQRDGGEGFQLGVAEWLAVTPVSRRLKTLWPESGFLFSPEVFGHFPVVAWLPSGRSPHRTLVSDAFDLQDMIS